MSSELKVKITADTLEFEAAIKRVIAALDELREKSFIQMTFKTALDATQTNADLIARLRRCGVMESPVTESEEREAVASATRSNEA